MDWALYWLITGIIAAGIMGPIIRAWSLHLRLLDVQRRLGRLEDNSLSDMNREKAKKRWDSKKFEDETKTLAASQPAEPETPWWARNA